MLAQHIRRWPNIKPTLGQCLVLAGGLLFWTNTPPSPMNLNLYNIAPLYMKGCICHFVKWQIHLFISKGMMLFILNLYNNRAYNRFAPHKKCTKNKEIKMTNMSKLTCKRSIKPFMLSDLSSTIDIYSKSTDFYRYRPRLSLSTSTLLLCEPQKKTAFVIVQIHISDIWDI